MTAAALFDAVKDCREAWRGVLRHEVAHEKRSDWFLIAVGMIPTTDAELILEALLARATGCGTIVFNAGFVALDKYGDHAATASSRVEALAAAYRSGVRA